MPAAETTTEAAPRAAKNPGNAQRSLVIDIVRGIAIILVALEHTNQGIGRRQWWGNLMPFATHLDRFAYSFHMPAFFFVSGVFLAPSVAKYGTSQFVASRARSLLYPNVIWITIFMYSPLLFGRWMMNHAPPFGVFLNGVLTGSLGWFLTTLFFLLMIGMWVRRWPMPAVFVVATLLSYFWIPTQIAFVDDGAANLPFLIAGMWLGSAYHRFDRLNRVVASMGALLLGSAVWFVTGLSYYPSPKLTVVLGLAGTMMLMLVGRTLGRSMAARALAWTGVASLGVYLMSPFAQGAARAVLVQRFHTQEPWVHLLVVTFFAVTIPAVVYHQRDRLRIGWLFEPPGPKTRADAAKSL